MLLYKWIGALSPVSCLLSTAWAQAVYDADPEGLDHANYIFNAIHSSMRHWGTSIYPNGVAFHLATVPKGTQFYHGTGLSEPIKGLEWLAFSPQHSLGFAHRANGGFHMKDRALRRSSTEKQQPIDHDAPFKTFSNSDGHGYLHTYAAAKDLRLLYIDGESAGPRGSMQSQDILLYNNTIDGWKPVSKPSIGGPPSEQARAILGCRMVEEVWGERIDGIVRTEGDFEIILCNFERDLEVVHITQTRPQENGPGGEKGRRPGGHGGPGHRGKPSKRETYWSLAARFDEALGQKIRLDFDHFVSAYTYGLDLFPNNATMPQLDNIPNEQLDPIRRDINTMINNREPSLHPFNWQHIADMIVLRYSDDLQTFAAGNFSSLESMRDRIEQLLEPFIDYRDSENRAVIVDRCHKEFIPTMAPVDSLGGQAVRSVSRKICSTFTSTLLSADLDLDTAVRSFRELVVFLGWTTWKAEEWKDGYY